MSEALRDGGDCSVLGVLLRLVWLEAESCARWGMRLRTSGGPTVSGAEAGHLVAMAAGVPLLSYHAALVNRDSAEVAAVAIAAIGALALVDLVMDVKAGRQVVTRYTIPLLLALFCLAFASYSAGPLFWILLGTALLAGLVIYHLDEYADSIVVSNLGVTLQVAIIPATYYPLVSSSSPSVSQMALTLVLVALALIYNVGAARHCRSMWLLCSVEAMLMLLVIFRLLGQSAIAWALSCLLPLAYWMSIQMLFEAVGGSRGDTT